MIENIYPRLTDTQKRAATYILKNYENIVQLNISELANNSQTSSATIVRLCHDLGYKRYQDFKLSLAQELSKPTYQIFESIEKTDNLSTIKDKVFHCNADAIQNTLSIFNNDSYEEAVKLISNARNIEIYGFGASGIVAMDAAHKFLKIGIKCRTIADCDMQAMSASLLGPEDVVIAISHSGRNKTLLYNIGVAKEAGAKIITVTNYGKSPILKYSDVVLYTASKETAFKTDAMSSRIAELTILDTLFVGVAFVNYDRSFENIINTRKSTLSGKNL
jgi:DNA-binding MurR/RpiR family transcriptional regulator